MRPENRCRNTPLLRTLDGFRCFSRLVFSLPDGFADLLEVLLDLRGVLQFLLGSFHFLLRVANVLPGLFLGLLGLADLLLGGADGLLGGLQAGFFFLEEPLGILESALQGLVVIFSELELRLRPRGP